MNFKPKKKSQKREKKNQFLVRRCYTSWEKEKKVKENVADKSKEKCSPICCGFNNVQKNKRRVSLSKKTSHFDKQSVNVATGFLVPHFCFPPLCFF